ncbi:MULTISPECIES: phospholipase [Vibrio oreintalis group]|uniref:Phospholipase n=1 Tax=Vibrio europaeus TaxID=300876 RepID=A0A178J4P6_9VIBR|nr:MULTISPECIES: phospholipase [Vibrio oreintalis group]MCG9578499.1 phospholipase [Vibrio tubiashii]MDC5706719.1 phospholipase [Vibrio europaeus]MDC5711746.1 phospholipase [Vibrio europaeus]MDC5716561.1 phospholipase [Vibrio europaeus]MDC5725859.1 phospholipase [Vibrio europaeus]
MQLTRTILNGIVLLWLMVTAMPSMAAGSDCPDYLSEDWEDKPFCVWLKNDTQQTIKLLSWKPYANSADINDDYWLSHDWAQGVLTLKPGELKIVAGIDDDGWGVFNYDTVKFRGEIDIDGARHYGVYISADIRAGVVNDFEYGVSAPSPWVDGHDTATLYFNGTPYVMGVDDEYDASRSKWDAMFSVLDASSGPGGLRLADHREDPKKINLMTWNTFLLIGPGIAGKQDYCQRAQAISDNKARLFQNVDVVVLSELASQASCTPDAEQLAVEEFLCCGPDKPFRDRTHLLNGTPLVDGPLGLSETGGVIVMSRYPNSLSVGTKREARKSDPIERYPASDEVHYEFGADAGECDASECTMDKGYLKVKFTKTVGDQQQDYYIIGSHTQSAPGQANENARHQQFQAMRRMADSLPSDAPILFAGDFNIESHEISRTAATLNADFGFTTFLSALRYSADGHSNYYVFDEEGRSVQKQYDFIVPFKGALNPVSQLSWVVPMTSTGSRVDLSDHHAVVSELTYE